MKYDAKFEMKAPGKEMHDAVRRWVRWTDMVAAARFSPPLVRFPNQLAFGSWLGERTPKKQGFQL